MNGSVSCYTDLLVDETINVVDSKINSLTSDDYGPQRWNYDGIKLQQTDDDEVYTEAMIDPDEGSEHNMYTDEDILSYNPIYNDNMDIPKARVDLNAEETSWMAAHEHLLETINEDDVSTWECNTYDDEMVDSHASLDNATFTAEYTEINKESYKIFGTNKGMDSAIWIAIRYSKQAAINMITRVKDDISEEDKEYLREIILDDTITLPKYIRTILPQHNHYKSLTCWLKTITTGTKYTESGHKIGYRPYPGTFAQARKEIERRAKKTLHIDYYKSTRSCPEGFANIWTTQGDKLTGTCQICFFTISGYREQISNIISRGKTAGYTDVVERDMNDIYIDTTGKTPLYKKIRALTVKEYVNTNINVLV
jgi:hypothetical protein